MKANLFDNKLFKKAFFDTNYYLISSLGIKLLNFFVIPILARVLTLDQFGEYDLFLIFANIFLLVSSMGMDSGLVIFIKEEKNNLGLLKFLFSWGLLINLVVIIILVVVLLGCGGDFYYNGSLSHALGGGLGFALSALLMMWVFGAFSSMP